MSVPRLACLALASLAAFAGCGPVVTTVRTSSAPPRPGNCAMKFVDADPTAPNSSWEVIGQVLVQGGGHRDAASAETRAQVAPEACRLGGDAVTHLETPLSPDAEPVLNYAVLKQSGPSPSAPSGRRLGPPQKSPRPPPFP